MSFEAATKLKNELLAMPRYWEEASVEKGEAGGYFILCVASDDKSVWEYSPQTGFVLIAGRVETKI